MFSTRIRSFIRPASNGATQCLRQRQLQAFPIPKTPISLRIQQQQRWRSARTDGSMRQNLRVLFRHHPYSMSAAFFLIGCCVVGIFYTNAYYQNYIIGHFHKYPEEVAKQLRKALWYKNQELDPKLSLKYFKEALRIADELKVDPFSDEIIGIKLEVAGLMEKIQQYQKTIGVLEIVKQDLLKWIELFGQKEGNEAKRTRLLRRSVEISVKLGELYSGEFVLEKDNAEERLVWAVETLLKEQQRRENEGVKPGEGDWMSPEEIGGTMEALAHFYEERNQHYLAAPLFLQAISQASPPSCHTVVLMNNLSISLAQQNPPPTPGQAPVSRSALISNAQQWAEKALSIAAKITPPERTEECDVGCAVATHNLGEFLEMEGRIGEAKKKFQEARSLAKGLAFKEGVGNAEEGLRRLEGK